MVAVWAFQPTRNSSGAYAPQVRRAASARQGQDGAAHRASSPQRAADQRAPPDFVWLSGRKGSRFVTIQAYCV